MAHISDGKLLSRPHSRRGFMLAAGAALMFALPAQADPFAGRSGALANRLRRKNDGMGVNVIDNIRLTDPSRPRNFLVRAYVPTRPGQYPTIIFSHGFGADMAAFEQTSRDWAARGYVVIHPTHADSLRYSDPAAPPGGKAALLGSLAASRQQRSPRARSAANGNSALVEHLENPFYLASRIADIAFLINCLDAGRGIDRAVHDRVKRGSYGMAGHSYGAYTTQVLAGARLKTAERNPSPQLTSRFAAFMAISGQGSGRLDLTEQSFATIKQPFFAITGTQDTGADGETPEWRLEPYYKSAPGMKFAGIVQGFTHMSFDADDENGAALRVMQTDFWDSFLKGDRQANNQLLADARRSSQTNTIWLRTR
ncbi:hypothetical protein PbB2_02159 [Candidatus Phycosocius bacilliformis]|uniref:Uncharacterized protein n=1 Tax=Candidatus Phycosocius bacilliformis TaxID=1445552 RepID=A0A2P2EBQ2_9PROT|nr:hypothetical protein [Candidatus Phycosocius bacilliformis]GBF58474.1 hypothetical protein PbB2_02159 [Candidatus Phycosocius bacilliformis]